MRLLLFACLSAAALLSAAVQAQVSNETARAAWKALEPEEQAELAEWLQANLEQLDSFQLVLIQRLRSGLERDPWMWPVATPPPFFDAQEHAPKQPITRALDDSKQAVRFRDQVLEAADPRRAYSPAWRYDYATREIRRLIEEERPERLFFNALVGYPPYLDFVEARLQMLLDDGEEQTALAAFGHAYSDRRGNVVPGLTLYDVWRSGLKFETPDVEMLGLLHAIDGPSRTFKAPVNGSKKRKLAKKIEGLFTDAQRHRGLRNALVRTYFNGNAALADGYQGNLDRLHALWEDVQSDPEELDLPSGRQWERWLKKLVSRYKRDEEFRAAGTVRRERLAYDAAMVRETAIRGLRAFGAFDRLSGK